MSDGPSILMLCLSLAIVSTRWSAPTITRSSTYTTKPMVYLVWVQDVHGLPSLGELEPKRDQLMLQLLGALLRFLRVPGVGL